MKKQVIIINGHPGSGKTTVAEMIAQQEKTLIRSSIDFVKEVSEEFFDWGGVKNESSRRFLSNMKRFLNAHTDLIEYDLNCAYNNFLESDDRFMVIDIREKNEIEKYKDLFDAVTVFVDNPSVIKITSNQSDGEVEDTIYDYTIPNYYCLEALEVEVSRFIKEIEMNTFKAELFLRNDGADTFINSISSINEAFPIMNKWLKQQGVHNLYTRQWMNEENEIILDFGSHHIFFVIKNQKGLFL